jgi:magnesium transporter
MPIPFVSKKSKKKNSKIGVPPGTLIYTGEKEQEESKIRVIDYSEEGYTIEEYKKVSRDINEIKKGKIRWVDITGFKNIEQIEEIGNLFELHPLTLEDILNPKQRPKYEDYGDYIFIVIKRLKFAEEKGDFEIEQISLILGKNYVISFQEQTSDIFETIIERIKTPKGRVRFMGADYLAYALIDIIIDNYFVVQEILGEIIEEIEDRLIEEAEIETLQSIYHLKRTAIDLRKSIWPMRDLINKLQREQSPLISDDLEIYLRDIYDHIFRISDSIQNYRDIISGMLDMYLSSVSNRMNEIMKVLTIISTIFIPLSFLAGLYGMNFAFMPELGNPFGYPILLVIMFGISIGMLYFFRRRKWI